MTRIVASLLVAGRRFKRRVLMAVMRPLFGSYGRNFWFDPAGDYHYHNIFVGDDVFLGIKPRLHATHSRIVIGNKVMFGPEVSIMAGNHRVDLVGRFMIDVDDTEKRPHDDVGVHIEDDVWVCTRAIILDGVRIGRGAIVAAGAVVTKSVPPYAMVAGVPARIISYRWDPDVVQRHEADLYPEGARLTREQLAGRPSPDKGEPSALGQEAVPCAE